MAKEYDIVLCGVTGFAGKLAAEHLLVKNYPIKWACCARNEAKAREAVKAIADRLGKTALPPIEVADLIGDEAVLRAVVKKTKVVLTCAGPFEKYSQTLVKLCAEEGVHYADITGESDFFRKMIAEHDATAQETGAKIVIHCGNDAIPWDLTVFEMSKLARSKGAELVEAHTYGEFGASAAASGGTLATAIFQLGKKRGGGAKPDFDPLLQKPDGAKSESLTKVANPKKDVYCKEFAQYGGPWIMGPVMANCVRRSNALLGYSASFTYADVMLRGHPTWAQWAGVKAQETLVGAAVMAPRVFARFLPAPGDGPSREDMDAGYLKLHARGRMVDKASGAPRAYPTRHACIVVHAWSDALYVWQARRPRSSRCTTSRSTRAT